MGIRFRVLSLAAFLMASGSAFAAPDPFDAEIFLSPYGDVAPALVTATSEEPASAPDAPAAEGPIGPIAELPDERFIPLSMPKEQRAAISLDEAPAVDLALHPDNFITSEPEIAAIIAADLASLAEMTTGSIELATAPLEVACLEGHEDR